MWGHCHLRVRSALSRNADRSKADSVRTPCMQQHSEACAVAGAVQARCQ